MLPRMSLQPTKGITEQAKGNDDGEAIITKEQISHLKRFSHIKKEIEERKGVTSSDPAGLRVDNRAVS